MKVGHVTERTDASSASSFLDSDELERTGIDLGTTGRLQLMARLAEGKFIEENDTASPSVLGSAACNISLQIRVHWQPFHNEIRQPSSFPQPI